MAFAGMLTPSGFTVLLILFQNGYVYLSIPVHVLMCMCAFVGGCGVIYPCLCVL